MSDSADETNIWKWRAAALGWMALIFLLSSSLFAPAMGFDSTEEVFGDINYVVRKCAHVTEYAILVFLGFRALWTQRENFDVTVFAAAAIAVFYAATDEYHQSFIPARSGKASDVAFDALGAGLMALWLVRSLKQEPSLLRERILGPLAAQEETEIPDSGK